MRTYRRRDFVRLGLGSLAAPWLLSQTACRRVSETAPAAPADFIVAFFTDPHVNGEKGAPQGFARAVEHAFAAAPRPELLITGGDLSFDILRTGLAEADAQYELFDAGLASVRVPIHHTLGNHDMLGVYEESGLEPGHPSFGKTYFAERYGLERTYYSFDHEEWHFVILDTLGIVGRSYRGWVDEEQIAWLEDDLGAASRPTVVVGHIPLFSNYFEWTSGLERPIPERFSVVNANRVAEVLLRHPVRLVIAGHLHIVEAFHYKGIEFANLGAVSGNWWNGLRDGFEEGYALLEFHGDQVAWRYVDYGWDAQVEQEQSEASG